MFDPQYYFSQFFKRDFNGFVNAVSDVKKKR